MSVHVISWVLQNSEAELGARLVLLAIADHAGHDGTDSYASVKTLAREARLSERATQYALRSLEENGSIVKVGTGPRGTSNYTVLMGGADFAGVQSTTGGGATVAPEPSFEPSLQSEQGVPVLALTAKDARGVTRARGWKVNRAPVSVREEALARGVLGQWNVQTGQNLTARDWLSMIVMRIREHSELGIDEHAHIITRALESPWWDDHPSPSVIYGNGAQFERCITAARNGHAPPRPKREAMRYGRGMTTEQILAEGRR